MPIYWPKLFAEEIVEYVPESLLGMVCCTSTILFIAEPPKSNRYVRALKIAGLTFTGAFASSCLEHYAYKFFLHNPIPTKVRNPLLHASIGTALSSSVLGLSFATSLSVAGFEKIPYLIVIGLIVGVYIGKTYADYLYDNNFYDKRFHRLIVRNLGDQDTIARLRYEQMSMERIQQKKIERMLEAHQSFNHKPASDKEKEKV